jgi:uncharacterized SAM-binding protein YcdF (DUF218 family)
MPLTFASRKSDAVTVASARNPLRTWLALQRWSVFAASLLLGMALGVITLAFVLAGDIYEYQDTVDGVHLPPVDAIIVLAGGRGRIQAAGDVWYRYWEVAQDSKGARKPPLLFISGMGPQSNWQTLTRQLRRGVLEVIRPENVFLEKESQNTEANALWVARHAEQRAWGRVLLITSSYHMKRSRFMFERILRGRLKQPVGVETLSVSSEPFEPGEWRTGIHGIRVTLLEYFKWIYYKTFWGWS